MFNNIFASNKEANNTALQEGENNSAHIIYDMAILEYSKECERAVSLDNKASFFMTIIIAISTIFIPILPINNIPKIFVIGTCNQKIILSISVLGIIVAFVLFIFAFIEFFCVYKLANYMRGNLDSIDSDQNFGASELEMYKALSVHYIKAVNFNINTNDSKCEKLSKGIKLCGIGMLFIIASAVCLIIIAE